MKTSVHPACKAFSDVRLIWMQSPFLVEQKRLAVASDQIMRYKVNPLFMSTFIGQHRGHYIRDALYSIFRPRSDKAMNVFQA